MKELIAQIEKLKLSMIKSLVDKRILEFKRLGKKPNKEIFKELCFCLLTANFNAERAIVIQTRIDNEFLRLSEKKLAKRLKELGYRFPNTRARYIVAAREYMRNIKQKLDVFDDEECKAREWLVREVLGLGYKEASHFLRNIGYRNLAIIDFHIVDLLVKSKLLKKPKVLNKKTYLHVEKLLKKLGKELNLNLAELDLYLWYLETGKVLK